jgi:hypothetical protein
MGCVKTKPTEEEALHHAECALNFSSSSTSALDLTFRKFSHNNTLNPLQFARACALLNIPQESFGVFTNITSFYTSLKDSEGNYPLSSLILLAVLLGKDSAENKAKVLYHSIDNELIGFISDTKIKETIEKLFVFSIDLLGSLVSNGQSQFTSELRNAKYLSDLNSVKNNTCCKVIEFLLNGAKCLTEKEFVEKVSDYCGGQFLEASGIRDVLYCTYLTSLPKKRFLAGTMRRQMRRYTG